jgi:hypothetical protein
MEVLAVRMRTRASAIKQACCLCSTDKDHRVTCSLWLTVFVRTDRYSVSFSGLVDTGVDWWEYEGIVVTRVALTFLALSVLNAT